MKGAAKPKHADKKKPQKTLKERRAEKRGLKQAGRVGFPAQPSQG